MATQIFISYSHDDTALLKAFVDALRPVARQRGWEIWWDDRVTAGRHLDATIKAAIAQSNVFLCFVSQAFLNSKYIREEELPRITEAVASRGALKIPVIVQDCHWKVECDGPRSVPLDRRGKLRPLIKWTPRSTGHHEASEQVVAGIDAHLAPLPGSGPTSPPPIPDDEPGPRIRRVADRFDVVDAPPPEAERTDPGQIRQHELLCRRIERVNKSLDFYRDSWEYLCQEFDDYREFASVSLDEIDLPSLIHAGNGLSAMVQASYRHDTTKTNTPALEPQVVALLEALLEAHALFVSGFEEGRELRARAAENRLQGEDQKDVRGRTETVLRELDRPADLLGPKAKKLVASTLLALEEGEWTYRDLVETSAALAANGLIGMGREVAPWLGGASPAVDAESADALPVSMDPIPAAVTSAIAFFARANDAVAAIAAAPDIRRFVRWLGDAAQTYEFSKMTELETSPSKFFTPKANLPEFSNTVVRDMILNNQRVPNEWIDLVTDLDFSFNRNFDDLSLISSFGNLRNLNISFTGVFDLDPISELGLLEILNFGSTKVTSLSAISNLKYLRWLDLSSNHIDNIDDISNLFNLQSLVIRNLDIDNIESISELSNIITFDLSRTFVSDLTPIASNQNIKRLYFNHTEAKNISCLIGLIYLTSISCSNSLIIDMSPVDTLFNLEILDASGLHNTLLWPMEFPASLFQLNLLNSAWPSGRLLPSVPWLVAPDGRVSRGEGPEPRPFRWWVEGLKPEPTSSS